MLITTEEEEEQFSVFVYIGTRYISEVEEHAGIYIVNYGSTSVCTCATY